MKGKYILLLISSAVIGMTGCQNEKMGPAGEGKNTHKLIVSAYADPDTKTSVTAVAGGYQVSWNVGDQIILHECAPEAGEDDYDAIRTYESEKLTSNDILDNKAGFIFEEIEDREASEFSYIATYGSGTNARYSDWSFDDHLYEKWAAAFEYTGEHIDPHMVIEMFFPGYQTPVADSFDPYADMMISDLKVLSDQMTGEASFRFARLGTIVKMTLTGLNAYAGKSLGEIEFSFGESFQLAGMIQYDPILNKYVPEQGEMMYIVPSIKFDGSNITVKEDGTADVWFRILSGELTDWFRVDISIDEQSLARYVDLGSLRKKLVFEEGGMTTFSVGDFNVPDVNPVGKISWTIPAEMDGFNATWAAVENASGYEAYIRSWSDKTIPLTPKDNGDGTWSVSIESGMMKDNYTIYVRPVPAEGHELKDSEYSTENIPIGVTSEYWFSHTTFSDDCTYIESTDYEYLIEVYSPGKVRFKNLGKVYDSSWTALEAKGDWFMYSTEPMNLHSIELWTKDNSHTCFNVYASSTPGAESQVLTGNVIYTSEINAGSGSDRYNHTHYKYRFTFPENGDYKYYTIKGTQPGTNPPVVMTSQYIYVYRYKMSSEE